MDVRYYIDPVTELPHIYNHHVAENEVEEVLRNRHEDRPGHDGSHVVIGQTFAGRYLRIIYVPDKNARSIFVVTAYELIGKSLTAYKRRKRR